jgi:hypothetical protein
MSKLFVRIQGLDRNIEEVDYKNLVKGIFGTVAPELSDDNIQLILDRKFGGYRNFCFVMCEPDNLEAWIAGTNETDFEGHGISVNEAQPLEERKPFNRDDRGGSRGGFGGGRDDRGPRSYNN